VAISQGVKREKRERHIIVGKRVTCKDGSCFVA
jgi:hypothetical protein